MKTSLLLICILLLGVPPTWAVRKPEPAAVPISAADLNTEVLNFFSQELGAHLDFIKSYDPAPDKVFSAGTTGEYTWGSFMNAVGAFAGMTGQPKLAGRDLAHEVGQIGLLEYRLKSTRFSQLYGVLALRNFGTDLNTNTVWQGLTEEQRAQWRKFLDVSAFYDPKTQQVINLPENYLGVAARIASVSYQLGLTKDRALVDGVITRAARPFMNGGLYSDDAPPTGRFDRYSNEYARFVWEAAESVGRKDILEALKPSLKEQMRLWWDLVLPDGYGYAWGRSMGIVSYLDTLEIVGFLGQHPEFRPAPLEELTSAYYQAWHWLRRDYNDKTHALSIFAFGRGNYAYITRDREWQQTINFFGKGSLAHARLNQALVREKITSFPAEIPRRDVARFVFFREGKRPAGVWLVRKGPLFFTLPITTGTKPGVADYLPAPYGLTGFANPVEQVYPSLTPFLQLADGRTLVATDGADEVEAAANGLSLRAVWKRWAVVGGKTGELIDPRITSEVKWRIEGNELIREETLRAEQELTLKRWWVALPSTSAKSLVNVAGGQRHDRFLSPDCELVVDVQADWPLEISSLAPGDSALARGARQPILSHLIYETPQLRLPAGQAMHWRLTMKVIDARP
jgi:hypothetical protein